MPGMVRKLIMTVSKPARGLKQIAQKATIKGMELALALWQDQFAERHFGTNAVAIYGMAPRTKRYMQRKAMNHHHQRTLEWSGETKRMILEGNPQITSRGKTSTMTFSVPKYFTIRSRPTSAQQPDKPAELKRVLQNEADQMGRLVAKTIDGEIERSPRKGK